MEYLRFSARTPLKQSSGFVLIMVLLILLATSFLVFSALETEQLEMRMVSAENGGLQVFLAAEAALKQMENNLAAGVIPPNIENPDDRQTVAEMGKNICNDVTYRLSVWLKRDHAVVELGSWFVVPSAEACSQRKEAGEVFWSEKV